MTETVLKISKGGFPPFSARECTQTLNTVQMGETKRTINGDLVYLGSVGQEKYASTLSGKDSIPPALENLDQGEQIQLECASTLTQYFQGDGDIRTILLKREPVSESVMVYTQDNHEIEHTLDGKTVELLRTPDPDEEVYISYRPRLTMVVKGLSTETHEWDLNTGWKLYLEER